VAPVDTAIVSTEATWLKTAVVAELLGYSPETIVDWAKGGRIPEHRFRKMPKGYLFHKEWVADPVLLTVLLP
jgi:hypothetical protein